MASRESMEGACLDRLRLRTAEGQEVFGTGVEHPGRPMGLSRRGPCGKPMKRDLMEILCCPVCKGDLELKVDVEKDEILEGSLFCKACNHRYEIKDGIPDLLPPDFK